MLARVSEKMTRLIVIQNVWRCEDNPLLQSAKDKEKMDTVIIGNINAQYHHDAHDFPERSPDFIRFNLASALEMSQRFFQQTSYRIPIFCHETSDLLQQLITQLSITHCRVEQPIAIHEIRILNRLQQQFPQLSIEEVLCDTLFTPEELQFKKTVFQKSFTHFRKKLEAQSLTINLANQPLDVSQLKPYPPSLIPVPAVVEAEPLNCTLFQPGEQAAKERLDYYLAGSHSIKTYKETRNGLLGFDFSSKLSPWLAHGTLSPKRVIVAIEDYEEEYGANESTYWLKFELLWREFFKHAMLHQPRAFFLFKGIQNHPPSTSNNSQGFEHWINGTTAHDFVNANMIELKQTGYMSNRGRQIVASYLVNELNYDWRMGAYHFQAQLIDYDVSSNWCNWAYLAGVGHDPRKRHFNIDKQQHSYDPDHAYIDHWLEKR